MDRRRLLHVLDAAAAISILAILAGWLCKTPLQANGWARRDLNDYTLNLRHSRTVHEAHAYPFGFTYPPPSVLFRLGLGALGFERGGGLWIAMEGAALVIALGLTLRLLNAWRHPGAVVVAFSALVLVKEPFEFEYKYLNANALFLALVLAGVAALETRPILGGVFLALSVALKLYSVVFLPWLLVTGRVRAFWSATASCVGLFGLAPALVWGPGAAGEITQSWLQRVRETGAASFPVEFAPNAYLVSLHAVVLAAVQRLGAVDELYVGLCVTRLLQVLWAVAVILVLVRRRNADRSRATLSDACLLLLAPLPLSGQLQPHHAVVLLPAAALLLAGALDPSNSRAARAVAAAAVGVSFLLLELGPPRPWRGATMTAVFLMYLAGLAALRRQSVSRD